MNHIKNRFLIGVLVIGILGVGALVLGKFAVKSPEKKEQEVLNRALQSYYSGELHAAEIDLNALVGANPNNSTGRLLLARVSSELGNAASAEEHARIAIELGAPRDKALILFARSLLNQQKYAVLRELIPEAGLAKDAQAEILAIKASGLLEENEIKAADELISLATQLNAEHKEVRLAVLRSLLQKKEFESAIAEAEIFVSKFPEVGAGWSLVGDAQQAVGDFSAAERRYTQAIETRRHVKSIDLLKRAKLRVRMKQYEKAAEDVARLRAMQLNLPMLRFLEGVIALAHDDRTNALEAFADVVEQQPNHLPTLFYIGVIHYLEQHPEVARQYLERVVGSTPNFVLSRKLLASLAHKEGRFQRVERLLRDEAVLANADSVTRALFATSLLKQGKQKETIEFLRQPAKSNPDSTLISAQLSVAMILGEDEVTGFENLETLLQVEDAFAPELTPLLATLHIQGQSFDTAIAAGKDHLTKNSSSVDAHILLGVVLQQAGQLDRAQAVFEKATSLFPENAPIKRNLALAAIEKREWGVARDQYRKILEIDAKDFQASEKLALLDIRERKFIEARERLFSLLRAYPNQLSAQLLLAQTYIYEKNFAKALEVLLPVSRSHGKDAAVLEMITRAYLANGEPQSAKDYGQKLTSVLPDSPRAYLMLAEVAAATNDHHLSEISLRRALNIDPDHAQARSKLATSLLQRKKFSEARENIDALRRRNPEHEAGPKLDAALSNAVGDRDKAFGIYYALFEKESTLVNLLLVSRQLQSVGRLELAASYLQEWLADHPKEVQAHNELAQVLSELGDRDSAILHYREALKLEPNNVTALRKLKRYTKDENPPESPEDRASVEGAGS